MKSIVPILFGAILLAPDTPCRAEDNAAEDRTAEEPEVCFSRRSVRNFDALSDEHVFIEERRKEYFLLTMRNRCHGLRYAQGIGINDTMSRICSDGFGEIIYRDGGRMQRCRIGTIERVQNKDEAKATIAERKEYEKHVQEAKDEKDD